MANNKQTSSRAASAASKVLRDGRTGKASKTAAVTFHKMLIYSIATNFASAAPVKSSLKVVIYTSPSSLISKFTFV